MTTAAERNEKVRSVLREAGGPMTPTSIARSICEPWCCYESKPHYAQSAAISTVLKRIGAVSVKRGLWTLPADERAA